MEDNTLVESSYPGQRHALDLIPMFDQNPSLWAGSPYTHLHVTGHP